MKVGADHRVVSSAKRSSVTTSEPVECCYTKFGCFHGLNYVLVGLYNLNASFLMFRISNTLVLLTQVFDEKANCTNLTLKGHPKVPEPRRIDKLFPPPKRSGASLSLISIIQATHCILFGRRASTVAGRALAEVECVEVLHVGTA
ncbi:hypothetical protein Syun_001269 [Stephania yunnanensis]|uniref:Uncharacterized protein n=1 Tax=Stephania yunnanensis TaxID=152371 RepID=A0AAP0LJ24_9MAGN